MAEPAPVMRTHFPPLPPGMAPLWAGVLGAPAAWGLQLQTVYAMAHWACMKNHVGMLHFVDLLTLVLAIAGGIVCFLHWRRPADRTDLSDRTHFLASLGLFTSALFAGLIIANTIATWMLDPCAT
jgi:hypothetical protein